MTSLVLFPDLKNLWSLIDLGSLCNLNGLNSLYSSIPSKIILILMVWSSMAPKWPIIVIFFGMDHQKSNFSLIYGTLSDGGCWGQPMLFFQNLVDETQMPKPQKYTDTFILTKKLFIVGLQGRQNISIPVERPCRKKIGEVWIIRRYILVSASSTMVSISTVQPSTNLDFLCTKGGYNLKLYNWNYLVLQLTETHKLYKSLKLSTYIKAWNH